MALKDIGYVHSLDRKGQCTSNSRTRNKRRRRHIFSDFILCPRSLSKTGVSSETFRYHNPLAKEKGATKIFAVTRQA